MKPWQPKYRHSHTAQLLSYLNPIKKRPHLLHR
jgi:hypothetical protein